MAGGNLRLLHVNKIREYRAKVQTVGVVYDIDDESVLFSLRSVTTPVKYVWFPKREELFGYIGGLMGCWLGISIYASVDIFERIWYCVQIKWQFRSKSKRSLPIRQSKVSKLYPLKFFLLRFLYLRGLLLLLLMPPDRHRRIEAHEIHHGKGPDYTNVFSQM
ncbi:hypothetical protein TNCV_4365861 [Trichonephila clavipes]|nr:hypothetical protein TNCV_4365861 [Trichonephila clavipes]